MNRTRGQHMRHFPPGGSLPQIVTTFTQAQAAFGFFGFFDTISNAARRTWRQQYGTWTGYFYGTKAILKFNGIDAGAFWASVDDGAEIQSTTNSIAYDGQRGFVIASGLSDTLHVLRIRSRSGYDGNNAYTFTTGIFLEITGSNPQILANNTFDAALAKHLSDPAEATYLQHSLVTASVAGSGAALSGVANVRPSINLVNDSTLSTYGRGGMFRCRVKADSIWIYTGNPYCAYSIDGGAWNFVTFPAALGSVRQWRRVATGLDNTAPHNYAIMGTYTRLNGFSTAGEYAMLPIQGVMIGGSGAAYSALTPVHMMQQGGDSISAYEPVNPTAEVYKHQGDIYLGSQAYNLVGRCDAVSGITTPNLDTALTTILAGNAATGIWPVSDVFIMATGRNDESSGQATTEAAYGSCIDKLVAAGYTKIICRTVTPDQIQHYLANVNTWISNVVTAKQAAYPTKTITLLNTAGWLNIETCASEGGFPYGGTHPDATGYVTLAGTYMAATYAAI